MPFNRVTDAKALVLWLLLLKDEHIDLNNQSEKVFLDQERKIPGYLPGFNLIKIPNDMFCNIDLAFHSVFLYVVGSVVYVVNSFYLWSWLNSAESDDAANPAVYLNTVASGIFIINAFICILDWWTQLKQLSLSCIETNNLDLTAGLEFEEMPYKQSLLYFWNNFFFLGAAVVFMIQSFSYESSDYDINDCSSRYWCAFWLNFWGNFLYLLSSVFSVFEFYYDRKDRKEIGLPPRYLFTLDLDLMDWFGWGDVLYFVTGIFAVGQSFLTLYIDDSEKVNAPYYLGVNVLFLLDSLAYFIGYMQFVFELRRALKSGVVSLAQTGAIQSMIRGSIRSSTMHHNTSKHPQSQQSQHLSSLQEATSPSSPSLRPFIPMPTLQSSAVRATTGGLLLVPKRKARGSSRGSGNGVELISLLDIKSHLIEAREIRRRASTSAMIDDYMLDSCEVAPAGNSSSDKDGGLAMTAHRRATDETDHDHMKKHFHSANYHNNSNLNHHHHNGSKEERAYDDDDRPMKENEIEKVVAKKEFQFYNKYNSKSKKSIDGGRSSVEDVVLSTEENTTHI
jgi:hypothetical protein